MSEIQEIFDMAAALGIKADDEFYLLSIAQHAVNTYKDYQHKQETKTGAAGELDFYASSATTGDDWSADLESFKRLVQTKRRQHIDSPIIEASPWLKLTSKDSGQVYYFNVQTQRRSYVKPVLFHSFNYGDSGTSTSTHTNTHTHTAAHSTHTQQQQQHQYRGSGSNSGYNQYDNSDYLHQHQHPDSTTNDNNDNNNMTHASMHKLRGSQKNGSARLSASFSPSSQIDKLRFTSWWTEGSNHIKRYVHITYYMREEYFEVRVDRDDTIYRLNTVKGKYGAASCWDLHLKATLNILGRVTTLMQCGSKTRKWIEGNVQRLLKLKKELLAKLKKYQVGGSFTHGQSKTVITETQPKRLLVEMHLRQLMKEVTILQRHLAHFRPGLAAKYRI